MIDRTWIKKTKSLFNKSTIVYLNPTSNKTLNKRSDVMRQQLKPSLKRRAFARKAVKVMAIE